MRLSRIANTAGMYGDEKNMSARRETHARLRLAELGMEVIDGGYKSGRSSHRDTPDSTSSATTRFGGTPTRRHLLTACGEMPNDLASAPRPQALIALSAAELRSMSLSQPQVDFRVNLSLVVPLNPGLHAYGMSPLGKTIKARLKALDKTQAWLAEQVEVSENAVSKWIKTGEISRENIKPAAEALQISVAQLLDPNPTPELDERWHSFPPSVKQRVLALIDELTYPPGAEAANKQSAKSKRRTG